MGGFVESRREFLRKTGMVSGAILLSPQHFFAAEAEAAADYTVRIKTAPIEIAPNQILSTITYNGQFPGPLIRFKEGRQVTVNIFNETDAPEQLHWHGQFVSPDVDGAAEEGTPYIPAHGQRRVTFTPKPSGLRFYHTHNRAGADLSAGQYSGQVGPVYIEPENNPGRYDREVFLVLKEFEPTLSRGGDMPQDFLSPSAIDKTLKETGEAAMKASLAKGMPHGYEVGYKSFTINGRMLGHGEPIRVKQGERVLFHILNGSATEIRSLALPGHSFEVIALDGNPVPNPTDVPVLWLGTAERISAVVKMNHPGVWILGDLADDDRHHGMGIVVEYAGRSGEPHWATPPPFRWSYARFAKSNATTPEPDETFEMTFAKDNAAEEGFNRWTINGVAYPMSNETAPASLHLTHGKRYRLRMRNASDDIHPIHLHRHSFELTDLAGTKTAGVMKDVVMLGGYQQLEVDFVADNPGLTLFHCHQQLHMDFGFMTLFDYV
ncbi:MAG TPA: multicopper oxidase domain-containing protein [Candidatus Udaeobacter sp.]|nr:multicopper oxidase domain-containing protein [Candidatus Udaeobacter sp.]